MENLYAALEIGTTRTILAIAEASTDSKRLKIICHSEIPSSGIRKSQILSIPDATKSIQSVLRDIEKRQNAAGNDITIHDAYLVVSGQHILATHGEGQTIIGSNRVTEADIAEVEKSARGFLLPKGRELLDIVEQDYSLDGRGGLSSPKGMAGSFLKLNTLQIHADSNRIHDAIHAAENARLQITEPVFAATCAADAVLNDTERKRGVLVIDFGGGSTGYAVYLDGYLVSAGVFGIGGDHVTNDIALAFQTTNTQAEAIKLNEASAEVGDYPPENARVAVDAKSILMETRTISRRALDTVVNIRLKELLAMIRETLEKQDLLFHLHAGCVIVGGGASLRNLDALIEHELSIPTRRGQPSSHVDGLDAENEPWAYAALAGALLYAQRNDEEPSTFLDGIFGRFFK